MIRVRKNIGLQSKLLNIYNVLHNDLTQYQEINLASDPDEFYSSRERASLAKIISPFKRTYVVRERINPLSQIEMQSAVSSNLLT